MADGFETIGWVLSVKDMATDKMQTVAKFVDKMAQQTAHNTKRNFDKLGQTLQNFTKSKAMTFIEMNKHLDYVQAHLAASKADVRGIISWFSDEWEGMGRTIGGVTDVLEDIGFRRWPAMLKLVKETGDEMKIAFDEKRYVKALSVLIRQTRRAIPIANELLQKYIGVERIGKFFDSVGGMAGILLGPFAGIFKLFRPFIDMFVDTFMPAIETFTDIVGAALGPFAITLEIIARNLAVKLMPHLRKFGAIAEIVARQLGMWLTKQIESGAFDKLINSLVKLAMNALPRILNFAEKMWESTKKVDWARLLDSFLSAIEKSLPLIEKLLLKLPKLLDDWGPAIITLIGDVAYKVADFFANFDIYMGELKNMWKDFSDNYIDPVFDKLQKFHYMLSHPLGAAGKVVDKAKAGQLILPGSGVLKSVKEETQFGRGLSRMWEGMSWALPGFARGGGTNRPAIFGEGGPEFAVPLTEDAVRTFVEPLLPTLDMPGMDQAVKWLERISHRLDAPLDVNMSDDAADAFGGSVGMQGIGAW